MGLVSSRRVALAQPNAPAPFEDWKETLRADWESRSLSALAVHCDLPRLAPIMSVAGDRIRCSIEAEGMWAARSEKVRQTLIQIAQLTDDDEVVLLLTQKWDALVPVAVVDMAPTIQQVFRECVPEDSRTARALRCLGQSMIFAPLSHIKHLVWQPFCTALRDCPVWDIKVDLDAYVRVCHTRRQVSAFGDRFTPKFDFTWQLTFLLNQKDCQLSDITLEVLSLRMLNPLAWRFSRRFKRRKAAILHAFLSHWPRMKVQMVKTLDD